MIVMHGEHTGTSLWYITRGTKASNLCPALVASRSNYTFCSWNESSVVQPSRKLSSYRETTPSLDGKNKEQEREMFGLQLLSDWNAVVNHSLHISKLLFATQMLQAATPRTVPQALHGMVQEIHAQAGDIM